MASVDPLDIAKLLLENTLRLSEMEERVEELEQKLSGVLRFFGQMFDAYGEN